MTAVLQLSPLAPLLDDGGDAIWIKEGDNRLDQEWEQCSVFPKHLLLDGGEAV